MDLEEAKDGLALLAALILIAFLLVFNTTHSRYGGWRIWPSGWLVDHGFGWLVTSSEIFAFSLLAVVALLALRKRSPF